MKKMIWAIVLILTFGGLGLLYFLAVAGGEAALKRDRREHLKIVNQARARNRLPPLAADQLDDHPEATPWGNEGFGAVGANMGPGRDPAPREADLTAELAPYVSIVLMLGESAPLDEATLRASAGRAWGVEITSDNPADDEFVSFKSPPTGMVAAGGFRFMVHDHPNPYFQDSATTLQTLVDPQLRQIVSDSVAWQAVDLLGQPEGLSKDNAYALVAKLVVELAAASPAALGIFLPEFRQLFPFDRKTRKALGTATVIGSLRESHMT